MNITVLLRALANERRLQILGWLKDPRTHFPPQVDGDLVEDGVCGVLIAERLEVTAPTLSEHMRILDRCRPCARETYQGVDHVQARREGHCSGEKGHMR